MSHPTASRDNSRPLPPHIQVYRPEGTGVLSILLILAVWIAAAIIRAGV